LVLIEENVIWQRWLRRKITQKCLEVLLLLSNLHIFTSEQIKEENPRIFLCFVGVFLATFEQLSLQKTTFDFFLATF